MADIASAHVVYGDSYSNFSGHPRFLVKHIADMAAATRVERLLSPIYWKQLFIRTRTQHKYSRLYSKCASRSLRHIKVVAFIGLWTCCGETKKFLMCILCVRRHANFGWLLFVEQIQTWILLLRSNIFKCIFLKTSRHHNNKSSFDKRHIFLAIWLYEYHT